MTDEADSNYVTIREIQTIFAYEMTKLDKEVWAKENSAAPRNLVFEHFERFKHELFKLARRPRRVHISDSDRPSGEGIEQPQPGEWDSTAEAEFERNKQRHFEQVARARRGPTLGLGRGETEG